MKISLGALRKLIRESLGEDWEPEKEMFYSILGNLADKNGGALPVTHETPAENVESIRKQGIMRQPDSHGIYFRVGWYFDPVFVQGSGAMVRVGIPKKFLNPEHIVPDDRYGTEGYYEFMEENPDVEGGDVGTSFDSIPKGWIKGISEF